MSGNSRVQHERGYSMKFSQAVKGVANCALVWVKYGASVRDLSVAEAIQARNEQAAMREPLPLAEIPGLKFELPANMASVGAERALAWEAGKFAAMEASAA